MTVVLPSLSDLLSEATQELLPKSSSVGQVLEHARRSRQRLLNFDQRCCLCWRFWPTSNNIWGDGRMSRQTVSCLLCGLRAGGRSRFSELTGYGQ